MTGYERYAVYYAPKAGSALAEFGNHWLGLDPETGEELDHRLVRGLDFSQIHRLSRTPARYGFHGTLKPPFRLAAEANFEILEQAVQELAASQHSFQLPRLMVKRIGKFVALVPDGPLNFLDTLAENCVIGLDSLRAPLSEEDLARRLKKRLSPHQRELLEKWGYPYVLDEFRFHLTLTGEMGETEANRLQNILASQLSDLLDQPVDIEELCLFGDPGNGQPFRLLKRFPLS